MKWWLAATLVVGMVEGECVRRLWVSGGELAEGVELECGDGRERVVRGLRVRCDEEGEVRVDGGECEWRGWLADLLVGREDSLECGWASLLLRRLRNRCVSPASAVSRRRLSPFVRVKREAQALTCPKLSICKKDHVPEVRSEVSFFIGGGRAHVWIVYTLVTVLIILLLGPIFSLPCCRS